MITNAPGTLAHRLQFQTTCKIQNDHQKVHGRHGLERGLLSVIGHSEERSLNRCFDPSTPSIRNVEPPAKSKMSAKGPQDGQRVL